jgi:7-carboxy-7-deazaguanine synthase
LKEREKRLLKSGRLLPLVEEFYTLQGEGFHMGKAAYFIRIGGCDVGCEFCDSKFSWNQELHPLIETDLIIENASAYPSKDIVITGGEPAQYNLDYLCGQLKKKNFQTYLETSGTYPLTGEWDWICLSPKKKLPPLNEYFSKANELKVIILNENDFSWAELNAKKVKKNCKLYLQPEWSRYHKIVPAVTDYIMMHPEWRISLQAHKFMKIP